VSNPELSAKVLGITNKASANATAPSLFLPSIDLEYSLKATEHPISKAPAPGITVLS